MGFLYVLLVDLAYYALLSVSIVWYVPKFIIPKLGELYAIIAQVRQAPALIPEANFPDLNIISISLLSRIGVMIIFMLLANTCAKGTIWAIILKKKPDWKKYMNLFFINSIIALLLFAMFYFGPKVFSVNILTVVLLVFLPILWHFIMASHLFAFKNSFLDALRFPFTRVHYFILPYIAIILVFVLVFMVSGLLYMVKIKAIIVLILIFFIAFFNWTKFLLAQAVKKQ